MKSFKHSHMAILPLLSILAMNPQMVQSKYSERSIASVLEDSKHPKFDELSSKVKLEDQAKLEVDFAKFKERRDSTIAKIKKDREEFKKDQSDKKLIEDQRVLVEKNIVEVLVLESVMRDLKEKNSISEADEAESKQLIEEAKISEESMIIDLEANEALLAKADQPKEEPKKEEPKKEDKPVVAEEPKKEEPKKEEPKKEDKPVVAEEPKKEEPKKEEPKKEEPKKEEEKKEVCQNEEKTKALTSQVEDLMKQNQQILQAMLGMTNMMVAMFQQQQHQQAPNPFAQGPGYNVSPYQYVQPMTAGNWVYYPQGFQPQQPNIFAQPMYQPQGQMPMIQQQTGIYPDQMQQQYQAQMPQPQMQMPQQQWGLQSQYDMRYQPSMPQVGNFGAQGIGFNMSNNNLPLLSMQ